MYFKHPPNKERVSLGARISLHALWGGPVLTQPWQQRAVGRWLLPSRNRRGDARSTQS